MLLLHEVQVKRASDTHRAHGVGKYMDYEDTVSAQHALRLTIVEIIIMNASCHGIGFKSLS